MKTIIVYESRYGNTKRVAEAIADEMRRTVGAEVTVASIKEVRKADFAPYDLILIGGPTHFGGPTRHITHFIESLPQHNVTGKATAMFDTYLGEDFEKSVKRMEEQIRTTVPGLKLLAPGLSIRVADMKGPIVDGELAKCKDFVNRLALPLAAPLP